MRSIVFPEPDVAAPLEPAAPSSRVERSVTRLGGVHLCKSPLGLGDKTLVEQGL